MLRRITTSGSLVAIIATGIFSFLPLTPAIAESAYNTPAVSGGQKCTKVGTAAKSKTGIQLVCTNPTYGLRTDLSPEFSAVKAMT